MSHECLSVVRKRILSFLAPKKLATQHQHSRITQKASANLIPSLDQSSPHKGDFLTSPSKLYIDNGITYVQLNLFGERFSRTLQFFAQDA
jgi:hypothetical protein